MTTLTTDRLSLHLLRILLFFRAGIRVVCDAQAYNYSQVSSYILLLCFTKH